MHEAQRCLYPDVKGGPGHSCRAAGEQPLLTDIHITYAASSNAVQPYPESVASVPYLRLAIDLPLRRPCSVAHVLYPYGPDASYCICAPRLACRDEHFTCLCLLYNPGHESCSPPNRICGNIVATIVELVSASAEHQSPPELYYSPV